MEKLLQEWRDNAAEKEEVNFRFVKWTKQISETRVDRLAKEVHYQVFEKIDCAQCANCCKTLKPVFSKSDIDRISKHLGQSKTDFIQNYLESYNDDLQINRLPCAFLSDDGHCTIYDVRPTACRDYPYTQKTGFNQRAYAHSGNTLTCPAVYHILELVKYRMGFRDRGW